VTEVHIAINRDEVRTDINLAVRHWSSNTGVGQSFRDSEPNQSTHPCIRGVFTGFPKKITLKRKDRAG